MSSIIPGTFANMFMGSFDPKEPHQTPAMARFMALSKFSASPKFAVNKVSTIAVSPFGPFGKAKAGFAYMHADVQYKSIINPTTKEPLTVPGLSLVRGDSVTMLIFLKCDGIDYAVLTEQARVPIDEPNYVEAVAGMSDAAVGKSGYAAAIAKELEEEVGLTLDRNTEFLEIGKMVPSAGGCDERIGLYWTRVMCDRDVLTYLEGNLGGALLENEQITARVVALPLMRQRLLNGTYTDAKMISCIWFYDNRSELHNWACARRLVIGPDGKPHMT